MKRNKGITLIALVITIIVLLILAGVSIAMLTGQNGILTQANESKIWTELGNVDDAYKTHILGLQASNNGEKVDLNSLTDILTKVTVGDSGYVYAIKDLSKLNLNMQSGKGEIPSNVTLVNDFDDVYIVDEKGNVAYIIGDKLYGNVELAQNSTKEDFFTFNEETGTITGVVENTTKDPNGVGYYYEEGVGNICSEKDIVIPSTINGVPVKEIGFDAFREFVINSVIIPDGVTTIGTQAFSGCASLTNITIPNSVTTIGEIAFYRCTSLTNIDIPNSVITIGSSAFKGCTSLTSIRIPNNVTTIEEYTFADCTSLTNVTIPDSVVTIGEYSFNKCISLTNVAIPDSVEMIQNSAFRECSKLINIIIPKNVTSIKWGAFYDINSNANIYCEATSEPSGWESYWTDVDSSRIHWGSTGPTE